MEIDSVEIISRHHTIEKSGDVDRFRVKERELKNTPLYSGGARVVIPLKKVTQSNERNFILRIKFKEKGSLKSLDMDIDYKTEYITPT